jgi:transcriptional regulator with XRE-family HTH domain
MRPRTSESAKLSTTELLSIGGQIRERRKSLKVSSLAVAESSGISVRTLNRVESGSATVALASYRQAMSALGLDGTSLAQARTPRAPTAQAAQAEVEAQAHAPVDAQVDAQAQATASPVSEQTLSRAESADVPPHSSVRISDYPRLRRLAWHAHGFDELTAAEALSIYERNWRYVEVDKLEPTEVSLIDRLVRSVGNGRLLV